MADPARVVRAVALCAPVVAATIIAFASGGYFITEWGVASMVLLALLAVVVTVAPVGIGGRVGAVTLGGWGALAAWQGVSSLWAAQPSLAFEAMHLTLFYGACFALGLVAARRAADLAALLHVTLAGTAVVCAYALGSRLLPGLIGGDAEARLSNPITYWNGLGVIAAFGALLAIALAARATSTVWLRGIAGALVPLLLATLLLTFSRGAVLCLAIALVVLLVITPGRLEIAGASLVGLGVSAPFLVWLNDQPALAAVSGQLPEHAAEGRAGLWLLLATMVAAGGLAAALAWGVGRLGRVARWRTGVSLAGVAAAAVVVAAAAVWPAQGPVAWAGDQFESFKRFDTGARVEAESMQDRIAQAAGSGRWQNWSVAAQQFRGAPVVGTGAGDYRFEWNEHRDVDLYVVNAHSLYLETLGELGVIGLVLLLVPMGATVWAVVALRRAPAGGAGRRARDGAVVVAAGALVALHAAGDWDWQLPATMAPAIALGGAALAVSRRAVGASPDVSFAVRGPLAVACAVALMLVAAPTAAQVALNDAKHRAAAGDLEGALARAGDAAALAPADPQARLLRAHVLTDLGDPAGADAAFEEAVVRSPRDWNVIADWAVALSLRGETVEARPLARRAGALNPREPRVGHLVHTVREGA